VFPILSNPPNYTSGKAYIPSCPSQYLRILAKRALFLITIVFFIDGGRETDALEH